MSLCEPALIVYGWCWHLNWLFKLVTGKWVTGYQVMLSLWFMNVFIFCAANSSVLSEPVSVACRSRTTRIGSWMLDRHPGSNLNDRTRNQVKPKHPDFSNALHCESIRSSHKLTEMWAFSDKNCFTKKKCDYISKNSI